MSSSNFFITSQPLLFPTRILLFVFFKTSFAISLFLRMRNFDFLIPSVERMIISHHIRLLPLGFIPVDFRYCTEKVRDCSKRRKVA